MDAYQPHVAELLQDLEDLHDAGQVGHWHAQLEELAHRHSLQQRDACPPFATLAAAA
ncbi:hypothetical protein [Paraburkholderia strydomiana]|uniref:hypothetical protein n=1 Tax=Paraburkholderia strydomiana TaxID=1245417 RepID=UPI002034EB99|nr:hypothetical protein [Paraburkholderia strydomiana]